MIRGAMPTRVILVLMGLLAFGWACSTMEIERPVGETEPTPGAFKVDVGFPVPGTKLLFRTTQHTGESKTKVFIVLEEGTYGAMPRVYRVDVDGSETYIFDKATANLIAIRQGENGPVRRMWIPYAGPLDSPHGAPSWPLWVGKVWTVSYETGDRLKRSETWKVESYEDVKVPAGTFKAFRLRSSRISETWMGVSTVFFPGTITIWYAPEVRWQVKAVVETTASRPQEVGELVEYYPAKQRQ